MFRILRCLRRSSLLLDTTYVEKCNHLVKKYTVVTKLIGFKFNKHFYSTIIVAPEIENANVEPNISEIVGDDVELEHKLRVIILETDILRQEGKGVPSVDFLKSAHWRELLNLPSKSARGRYLEYLFKVEKKKENREKKKEEKRLAWEENPLPKRDPNDVTNYSLGGNNIMLRVYETTMNQMYNNRLIQAMKFGQKLVIDCGYHNEMTRSENSNCAKQLTLLFAENRFNDEPFDLNYCNVDKESYLMKVLHKFINPMYEPWFPLNLHEKSYLDMFPKEKLVYLTPHCREVLTNFNHDDIYIIGAIVDKGNTEPLSLAKAKREGLRMAKLPLDYHLEWGSGSGKSLTINQVTSILLDIKETGNWKHALRHVPRRKLASYFEDMAMKKFVHQIDSDTAKGSTPTHRTKYNEKSSYRHRSKY
ncbi:hypothetical protein FQA39_LY01288 [Lamprigera yunnana]|nr:hypothetical protein FQA39_LY01288 [Lamprigera yunnana]